MEMTKKQKVLGFVAMSGAASIVIGIGARKQFMKGAMNVRKRLEEHEARIK